MRPTFWLASYPKSGNTWFRLLASSLMAEEGSKVDIRRIDSTDSIASARGRVEHLTLIETGLLPADVVDTLRPSVYRYLATVEGSLSDPFDPEPRAPVRLVKTHDGYTYLPDGQPMMGGPAAAAGAILFVRDPRDVAPSFANHGSTTIDSAIRRMADPDFSFCDTDKSEPNQLRQQLLGWSGFASSWLDQRDIPVHLVRYEDMHANGPATLRGAVDFLGLDVSDERIDIALAAAAMPELQRQEAEHGFGEKPVKVERFFRRGEAGGWRDELTGEQVAQIERDHYLMMQRLGYELTTGCGALA